MTVVAVGSWRGVGTSTAALLLAAGCARAGSEAWLVEGDPAGGVITGRAPALRGQPASLSGAAFESRSTQLDEFVFRSHPWAGVRVFTGAVDPFEAWSAVATPRHDWVTSMGRLPGVCVVDVGSLRGGPGPGWRLVEVADVVVMVTSADPVSCASTVHWLDAKGQSAPGVGGLSVGVARLLVVDAPITAGERLALDAVVELGEECVGWWPWEPRTVDAVVRGAELDHRSVRRTALVRAVGDTVAQLGVLG